MEDVLSIWRDSIVPLLPREIESFLNEVDAELVNHGLPEGSIIFLILVMAMAILYMLFRMTVSASSSVMNAVTSQRDTVLLIGPSGGGKTVMYHQLMSSDFSLGTVPSQVAHGGQLSLEGPTEGSSISVALMDMPGAPRLRSLLLNKLPTAQALVLVLDATSPQSKLRDAAELLYDVLTHPSVALAASAPPLLVCANKADRPTAATPAKLKAALQRELNAVKHTRASLGEVEEGQEGDGGDMGAIPLGRPDQPFSFDVDSPCEAVFEATVALALKGKTNVAPVRAFLGQIV